VDHYFANEIDYAKLKKQREKELRRRKREKRGK